MISPDAQLNMEYYVEKYTPLKIHPKIGKFENKWVFYEI